MGAAGGYLWSGWGSVASICLFLAAWDVAAGHLGELILPRPQDALVRLQGLLTEGQAWPEIAITARRALAGFALSVGIGSLLGLLAGLSVTASMTARPLVTLLVGMPPIAWLILALLWFGAGDGTPVFTVFIACFPIIFVGAMQGTRTLDGQLRELARMFRLPPWMRLTDVILPHVVSYLFPAWISALGMSWKIVVMAELLSTEDGIGAALAVSRSHLDTAASMAWIVALVSSLLAIEYLLLEPLKRHVESWREFASSRS
ncbi:ABC transporter permease subunit [Zoogloea sp.]|uniref:ABC transporter permease n=1 Tax=Zoogloea sp. TaxID=49181 RepID=UPI001ACD03D6|nr:ABC transporter permease subunit [Zoogloea sp.]MBN8284676.1 ABC transporter permease subunit [Zoogloea sp.]